MCISMELVTAVLGDHGQRPQEDYGKILLLFWFKKILGILNNMVFLDSVEKLGTNRKIEFKLLSRKGRILLCLNKISPNILY